MLKVMNKNPGRREGGRAEEDKTNEAHNEVDKKLVTTPCVCVCVCSPAYGVMPIRVGISPL